MFLFQRIEETTMKYNDARHAVGEFMIQEWKNLHAYTITDIAEKTYTSKSTVTRFAKSLGYDGWREFMKDYVEEIRYETAHSKSIDFNFPFSEKDNLLEISESIRQIHIESVEETADLIKPEILKEATKRLINAKRIVIFAASPNTYLAEIFKRKLLSIGYMAMVPNMEKLALLLLR